MVLCVLIVLPLLIVACARGTPPAVTASPTPPVASATTRPTATLTPDPLPRRRPAPRTARRAIPTAASLGLMPTVSRPATATPSPTQTATASPDLTSLAPATPMTEMTPDATAEEEAAVPASYVAVRVVPAAELPQAHFWLRRPFSPDYSMSAVQSFPYGSTGGGQYVLHTGADIMNPWGTPILAAGDGIVVWAGDDINQVFGPWPDYYGRLVILKLALDYEGRPIFVLYGHVSESYVQIGQHVRAGDVIAAVGMTGIAIGPHLHTEVRVGENSYLATRNPEFWLEHLPGHGALAGRLLDEAGQPIPDQMILVYRQEQPDEVWQIAPTYLAAPEINSDELWAENFVLADVPAGDYWVESACGDMLAAGAVHIEAGQVTFVEIRFPISPPH